jgi:hypothetical protein
VSVPEVDVLLMLGLRLRARHAGQSAHALDLLNDRIADAGESGE